MKQRVRSLPGLMLTLVLVLSLSCFFTVNAYAEEIAGEEETELEIIEIPQEVLEELDLIEAGDSEGEEQLPKMPEIISIEEIQTPEGDGEMLPDTGASVGVYIAWSVFCFLCGAALIVNNRKNSDN